jgi:hypothetical protein
MKAFKPVLALLLAVVALLGGTGVAAADTIVGPGKAGHVCSNYAYLTTNPNRYFQTCAWADANTVWFTIHFGNASGTDWLVKADLGYWQTGTFHSCFDNVPITVKAHSTLPTTQASCDFNRARAAYQAFAYVAGSNTADSRTTDTLQVQ